MIAESVLCLALNIFFEARGESIDGQLAVAEVTLNRVADDRYPDTVCDVVWEPYQFSWTHDGKHDDPSRMNYVEQQTWQTIQTFAEEILSGEVDMLNITSTHYHSTQVSPSWASLYEFDGRMGVHLFYTNTTPYR